MSAILAVVSRDRSDLTGAVVSRMQAAMAPRGHDRTAQWEDDGVVIAVQRAEWECGAEFAGHELLAITDDVVVAADASLYYRADLRQRLATRDVRAVNDSPGQLILAAYRAFGANCAEVLEGDFAFVVWDRQRRELVAARDHAGTRGLYHAKLASGFAVASSVGGARAHPSCRADFDLATLALDAAGLLFGSGDGTAFAAIRQCPAGATLMHRLGSEPTCNQWFTVAVAESRTARDADQAAEGLREVLSAAIDERATASGPTAVWVSGGFDSTAVLALAQRIGKGRKTLVPISMAFPEGDSANERALVDMVAAHLRLTIQRVDGRHLPPIGLRPADDESPQDEPFGHVHTAFLQALASATRKAGARVALTGHGGDFLFQCAPYFLSDLARRGRLLDLCREWFALGVQRERVKQFWKFAVEPIMPHGVRHALGAARGRPLMAPFQHELPAWMNTPLTRTLSLSAREQMGVPPMSAEGACAAEFRWYHTAPGFARIHAASAVPALMAGVEVRAPLQDPRVIRFAGAGAREERFADGESKRLLRHAMSPLLPAAFLAPRTHKTGTLDSYVQRSLTQTVAEMERLFASPRLADLGLVDTVPLRRALARAQANPRPSNELQALLFTAWAEQWLQALEAERSGSRNEDAFSRSHEQHHTGAVAAGAAMTH